MFSFADPWYMLVLLLIPIYGSILLWSKTKHPHRPTIYLPVWEDLQQAQGRNLLWYLNILRHVFIITSIILFAITLSRPQSAHEKKDVTKKGIDIVIALDVSQSMLAKDLEPNRIEAAKQSIQDFVNRIENDRLGIVIFSGKAFTQSPLTFDYAILQEYIERISPESINQRVQGLGGTAIGDALLAGVTRLRDAEETQDQRSKVIILVTDGDANVGVDPTLAAQKVAQEDIRIYTIGIGKEQGAPIPVQDQLGRTEYARNPDGSLLLAQFDEDRLREIAKIGEGQYFRADDTQSFEQALAEINTLQKRDITVQQTTEYTENFYPFLLALATTLLATLSLHVWMNVRK